jgi:cobaltochelatase CobN
VIIGTALAYFMTLFKVRGKNIVEICIIISLLSPPFIGAYSWILIGGRSGILTQWLAGMGIDFPSIYGFAGILLVLTLKLYPFIYLYVAGAMKNIDSALIEAAESLGCSGIKKVVTIMLPLITPTILAGALMVFMNAMGIRLTEEQRDKIQMAGWTGTNILTTMSVNPDNYIVSVDSITADTLNAYLRGSSRKNYRSMLNYVRQNVDGKIIFKGEVEKAVPAPEGMFSHPDIDNPDDEDLYFDNIKEYEAYLQKHGLMKADAPKVIVTGMMGNPDDLVTALEKSGNTVYHVNKSLSAFIEANPSLHFNAVVNLAHGRLGDKVVEWLGKQNIPLFSTLSVNRLTSEWEDDKQGMSGGFLSQSIVTPEIDGSIRPYVLFAQRINNEGIHEQYTIPERLENFVTTVNSYISLQKKNNKDKRVAIVYFKGPGEQSLTASGLAVVPSLYNLLTRMRQEGYNVSGLPENSEKLAELLQRKGSPISDFSLLDAHPDTVVKVQFGNIALLPQPLAGHGDNTFQIVHGTDKDPVKEFQNA